MKDNEHLCQEDVFGKRAEMPSNLHTGNRSSPGFGLRFPSFDPTSRPGKPLSLRSWRLKIDLKRVVRIGKIVVGGGCWRRVICREYINWRRVCCRARLALHIPQVQVLEDLFDHILICYESDDPHSTGTL